MQQMSQVFKDHLLGSDFDEDFLLQQEFIENEFAKKRYLERLAPVKLKKPGLLKLRNHSVPLVRM